MQVNLEGLENILRVGVCDKQVAEGAEKVCKTVDE